MASYLLITHVSGIPQDDPNYGAHYSRYSADDIETMQDAAKERGETLAAAYKKCNGTTCKAYPEFDYTVEGIYRQMSPNYSDDVNVAITVPKAYANDAKDRFADFFGRIIADLSDRLEKGEDIGLCGNYELETAQMLRDAFQNGDIVLPTA